MFKNREDAGQKLAEALEQYKDQGALVLAIPRGGVEVGFQVARNLRADFAILISRKLPFPDNPEAGFGALAEDGSTVILKEPSRWISEEEIKEILKEQSEEIRRRVKVLREGKTLPVITGKTVILVDDGLAMGSTMRAAVKLCRKRNARKIVMAVPVAGDRVAREMAEIVDDIVILEVPKFFRAVAQVYSNWYDVSDEEVLEILEEWGKQKKNLTHKNMGKGKE